MGKIGKTLHGYLFWTYQRGSFHYDVMVTLILAFIFLTPLLGIYHDRPEGRKLTASQVLVKPDGPSGLVYEITAEQVTVPEAGGDVRAALAQALEPISGEVTVDRFETVKDATGRVTAYKVWAHR